MVSLCLTKTHLLNSCTWQQMWRPVPYTNNSTARLIANKNNSKVTYCNQIGLFNLQTQHILTSQSYQYFAGCSITVIVIITCKTILNDKVGYHLPGNSGAARMGPKRPLLPPKQACSDFCQCFLSIFSCYKRNGSNSSP